jgi:hypothetical protein
MAKFLVVIPDGEFDPDDDEMPAAILADILDEHGSFDEVSVTQVCGATYDRI